MKENTSNNLLYNNKLILSSYIKIITICSVALIVSCKAKKQFITNRSPVTDNPAKKIDVKVIELNSIRAGQTDFNTFSARARTKLDINGNSNDVTLNIRIKKNQKIWVSITAIAGIEVARALITPDSILVINRLQGIYLKKPFGYINKLAGDQINYKTLESLLLGNAIPELINEKAALRTNADTTTLSGNLGDVVYKLIIGPGMKALQTDLNNEGAAQSLKVTNSTFIQSATKIIPSQIDIRSAVKDKKLQVNLHYIKSDFDLPLEYPLTIPARYTEAE